MTMSSGSSKKGGADKGSAELKGVDRLFGCDLRSKGWFVDPVRRASGGDEGRRPAERDEQPLDPALIWALRGRRR